jgi:hypothetical protein
MKFTQKVTVPVIIVTLVTAGGITQETDGEVTEAESKEIARAFVEKNNEVRNDN